MNVQLRSILILGAALFLTEGCRHAYVRYGELPPAVCVNYPESMDCARARKRQTELQNTPGERHIIKQNYYLFGYYPRNVVLDVRQYCPGGPRSIHRYTGMMDGFLEQLTFTIYSPQTVEIECAPQ